MYLQLCMRSVSTRGLVRAARDGSIHDARRLSRSARGSIQSTPDVAAPFGAAASVLVSAPLRVAIPTWRGRWTPVAAETLIAADADRAGRSSGWMLAARDARQDGE
jgi:hypothetical protein